MVAFFHLLQLAVFIAYSFESVPFCHASFFSPVRIENDPHDEFTVKASLYQHVFRVLCPFNHKQHLPQLLPNCPEGDGC